MSIELDKLTRKYMSLVNVSTTLNTELDLVQLLPVIMLNAKDLLEAEASSLFLTDEKNEFLYCEVAIGEKDEIVRTFSQIPMGDGLVGWVAQHGKPVLLEDAYDDARFSKQWDLKTGFRTRSLICVPLFVKERVVGILEVLNKKDGGIFDRNDQMLLSAMADMAAVAIQNAKLNESLRKRVLEVSMLYDFENLVATHIDLHELGKWLLSRVLTVIEAKTGSILIWDSAGGFLKVLEAKGIDDAVAETLRIFPGEGVAGHVAQNREPLLIPNIAADPRFQATGRQKYEDASLISVPLISQGDFIGVLNVNNKISGYAFSQGDLRMVTAIASRLAMTIKNAHFFSEKERNDQELNKAEKLMSTILPHQPPEIPGLTFGEFYRPHDGVGGDFYSYVDLAPSRLGVLAVDLTGHGLSAALLAVMVNTLITTFDKAVMNSPGEFMIQLNEALINRLGGNFATAVYIIIDTQAQQLTYASAGHPHPLLARNAEQDVLALKCAGKLLGVVSGVLFEERQIPFLERDRLIMFTDGLLEITDGTKQFMYGDDELKDFVRREAHRTPAELCKMIVDEAQAVTGATRFDDDVTLLVVGR
jgi:phosphoserine phosphatase RsbU/P